MSAMPARAPRTARPLSVPTWRPRLRIVRAPAPARTVLPFILLCMAILGGALLGALALNTAMASTAYEMHDQEVALARLSEEQQVLAREVDTLGSPAALSARAAALGMVPAEGMNYILLEQGTVLGEAAGLIGEDG
ncbi:Cell division protein FtsL [Occultella aeris]|uniref:Cell division protein FtsL n=2 Tax=Ruaniaceae TaxID=1331736 RepID=A0A7M4DNZ0_9MICO|nr:Cell division protein FtsL [Occultella aeris]